MSEHAKSDGQREQQNKPADLSDAEGSNLFCHIFVTETDGLQIAHEAWLFRGVNQPTEHTNNKRHGAGVSPVPVEAADFCPPIFELRRQ